MDVTRWSALCPLIPPCGWNDPGYRDEFAALAESRAHTHEAHPGYHHAWPSREVGVVAHYQTTVTV